MKEDRARTNQARIPKLVFVTGKGGVGKSTIAWAQALRDKRRGLKTAVASWLQEDDQAEDLTELARSLGVEWIGLRPSTAFREYISRTLYFEKMFDAVFENRVFRTFMHAAPGLGDTVVAGKLWDAVDRRLYDTLYVDMPSTGHAISFFRSPHGVREIFTVGLVHRETEKILALFHSAEVRIDIVLQARELPFQEALELSQTLRSIFPKTPGRAFVNHILPEIPDTEIAAMPATPLRGALELLADAKHVEKTYLDRIGELDLEAVLVPAEPDGQFDKVVERLSEVLV